LWTESKLFEKAVFTLKSKVSRAIEKSDFWCEDEEKNEFVEMGFRFLIEGVWVLNVLMGLKWS
jgi:hypothetical protein